METQINVRDEVTAGLGRPPFVFTLRVAAERLTVRDLIRARVFQEVQAHNERQSEHFQGLMQPRGATPSQHGYRLQAPREIDAEEQYALALAAFAQNGFVLLVNDRQVNELDTLVEVSPDTTVTFLKLVPLVGG